MVEVFMCGLLLGVGGSALFGSMFVDVVRSGHIGALLEQRDRLRKERDALRSSLAETQKQLAEASRKEPYR